MIGKYNFNNEITMGFWDEFGPLPLCLFIVIVVIFTAHWLHKKNVGKRTGCENVIAYLKESIHANKIKDLLPQTTWSFKMKHICFFFFSGYVCVLRDWGSNQWSAPMELTNQDQKETTHFASKDLTDSSYIVMHIWGSRKNLK